ncbi:MAG: RNase adapter RapZ, partial [Nitrospirota bacterium]|nr:RNase adapter RapZ [Nitrospirota bacterium]
FVLKLPEAKQFLLKLYDLFDFLLPLYRKEGKSYLAIGIGCTGGRHRSVSLVNKLKDYFENKGLLTHCRHRDVEENS